MSAASIPYHLRPHKSVDRRLFLDLLARFERWRPLSDYVYISMGAYPLEDHKLVHRLIGIPRLIAFDLDVDIVARQSFNKPVGSCCCLQRKSADLISNLDAVLAECEFSGGSGIIIWLDYSDPRQIGYQIREFQELLGKLRAGDIVRITVNAHANDLLDPQDSGSKPLLATVKMTKQFQNLKSRIGDFLPSQTSSKDMTPEGLPRVISMSFAAAALKALPMTGDNVFRPLSVVRYADAQQMLSITGVVVARNDEKDMLDRVDMKSWPFASNEWTIIHRLVVPALTIRERLFLERGIMNISFDELVSQLGFETAAEVKIHDFLESYKQYYRFYPTLLATEV
jgi:hypothetical protein